MKKLLLSSALLLACSTSVFAATAHDNMLHHSDYTKIQETIATSIQLERDNDFYTGNFQSIAEKSDTSTELYKGNNAAAMASVIMFRF